MSYTFLYMFFTAFSSILRGIVGSKIPIMLSIFLSTLFAVIFFHAINAKNIINIYRKIISLKKLYTITAFSVLIMWMGSFSIPVYYSPTIQVFAFMAITSFYGSLFLYMKSNRTVSLLPFSFIAAILASFYIIYFLHHPLINSLEMLAMTMITGTSGYIYFLNSNKLNQHHLSASEILTVRFWPLLFVSLFFVLKDHQYAYIGFKAIKDAMLVGITSLIVPIYCSQKSIEKMGPELHGILIGLCPYATFTLEKLTLKNVDSTYGYLSAALFFAIAVPYFSKMIKQKTVKTIH